MQGKKNSRPDARKEKLIQALCKPRQTSGLMQAKKNYRPDASKEKLLA